MIAQGCRQKGSWMDTRHPSALLQKVLVSNGVLTHLVLAVTPRGGEDWPWRVGCCQGLNRNALELKERKKEKAKITAGGAAGLVLLCRGTPGMDSQQMAK